jgi:hypothetical protein
MPCVWPARVRMSPAPLHVPDPLRALRSLQYLEKYDIDLDPQYDEILGRYQRKPWSRFITSENQRCVASRSRACTQALPC